MCPQDDKVPTHGYLMLFDHEESTPQSVWAPLYWKISWELISFSKPRTKFGTTMGTVDFPLSLWVSGFIVLGTSSFWWSNLVDVSDNSLYWLCSYLVAQLKWALWFVDLWMASLLLVGIPPPQKKRRIYPISICHSPFLESIWYHGTFRVFFGMFQASTVCHLENLMAMPRHHENAQGSTLQSPSWRVEEILVETDFCRDYRIDERKWCKMPCPWHSFA